MPEISRFFGIIIWMYVESDASHHAAHFHVYYQDNSAIFKIDPIEIIAGSLPLRQKRLVEAWTEIHQAELISDWNLLQQGRLPFPIDPLK